MVTAVSVTLGTSLIFQCILDSTNATLNTLLVVYTEYKKTKPSQDGKVFQWSWKFMLNLGVLLPIKTS